MKRINQPLRERKDFNLYIDEFQSFTTEAFSTISFNYFKKSSLIFPEKNIKEIRDRKKIRTFFKNKNYSYNFV
jgi:hypothetical protein